ncbi:MAG: aminotransferase class III-fold pyridoxal phosphate-dependent enzyme [Candidatus Methanofastidiosa archaeon]|nr:aminotransferase class III-fold pyridoxal phosphate-dependent enzyme [Candidatus Methanofastidiosa archaeon]
MPNSVGFNQELPTIIESEKLYKRSQGLIPCNTQTMAKGPTQYVDGVAPKYLVKGKGARVWDVDGNEYIDYNMGIGPISLGYAYPEVDKAITEQLSKGITFSLVNPLEIEVAELIKEFIPNAESVRYSKTGAEVTSAAVRIARAFTRRNRILACGYHGWHDWYASTLPRNGGIPDEIIRLTDKFNYNDLESLEQLINYDVAAVIIEPTIFDKPENDFLHGVQELCLKYGSLLIFDEMWTGFRMSNGGAQEYYGVTADLATFSKAIANGMPISVVTGRHDVMQVLEEDVFFFNTFGGEALSLAAAKATLEVYKNKPVIEHIWNLGALLEEGLNNIKNQLNLNYLIIKGYPYRLMLDFAAPGYNPLVLKSFVQQELIRRGILWSGTFTLSFSHSEEEINYTLKAFLDTVLQMDEIMTHGDLRGYIKGDIIKPSFRPISNFRN